MDEWDTLLRLRAAGKIPLYVSTQVYVPMFARSRVGQMYRLYSWTLWGLVGLSLYLWGWKVGLLALVGRFSSA